MASATAAAGVTVGAEEVTLYDSDVSGIKVRTILVRALSSGGAVLINAVGTHGTDEWMQLPADDNYYPIAFPATSGRQILKAKRAGESDATVDHGNIVPQP